MTTTPPEPLSELEQLRRECDALLKFVQCIESCDYNEHGDYVKARELELLQEHAGDLLAEIEDGEV